jgi:flagellar hook-associated protein 1 FlgK
MTDIAGVLSIGSKALLAQQKGIYVTGNNIANVNTPGYTRQRLNLSSDVPVNSSVGLIGTGVAATGVERVYQRFLGAQINNETQTRGNWEAQKDMLGRVEMIFDESGGYGLNQVMSEFWTAWQDLSNNPSGPVERTVLIAKSEILAETFSKNYRDLQSIQQDIDIMLEGTVDEINLLSEQVAHLNQKIIQMESGGNTANDYRDQRDVLLSELSDLIEIDSFENSAGGVTVSVGSGQPLVEGTDAYRLSTQINASGNQNITWVDFANNAVDITSNISGGKVKGWLDVRDLDISNYMNRLDTLAQNLMTEVNTLHASGYGLAGSTGNDYFTGAATASALNMQVNQAIVQDYRLIAAAESFDTVPGDKPGDNGNAIAIANLKSARIMNSNTATFDAYYESFIGDVGYEVQQAGSYYEHQSEMVHQLENYRESISGVSIDEEMINLVKYQNAYQAAAKLITTADEMMQSILNMI